MTGRYISWQLQGSGDWMSKVSVIMPVYNAGEYLEKSIECILDQTHSDLELICVNDGSTDNSLDILNDYAAKDSRVRVFSQTNQGGGAARNFAMGKITGKYLYFMDADDEVRPETFSQLIGIMEEKNLDFIIFSAINYAEDTGELFKSPYYTMAKLKDFGEGRVFSFDDLGNLIFDISVTPWCKFYDAGFVKRSGARFLENSIFHDNQFFWEVLFNAERMTFVDGFYYTRRRHSASSTGAGDERYVNIINVVNNIIMLFVKYGQLDRYRHILYNKKVVWIYARHVEIKDEFRQLFYEKMKEDFSSIEDESFESHLDEKNRFIFDSAVNSKTLKEFELLMKNYELTRRNMELKNRKKLPNFIKYRIKKLIKP